MIQKTKEAELTSAVLLYAIRCIAEADYAALRQMKIGEQEIEQLKRIGLLDLYHLDTLRSHCVSITINREIFSMMIKYMRSQRESEQVLQELIDNDAPYEMVNALHGMSTREYTQRRKSGSDLTSVGRPREPSEEESENLWDSWSKIKEKDGMGRLTDPAQYLDLALDLNMSLRSVWLLTERWIEMDQRVLHEKRTRQNPPST